MERWRGLEEIPAGWGRCVLTVGMFDGVHRGHQALIADAVASARELGLPTVVMTFDPHPAEVVRPGNHPAMLATLRRRAELIAELGVDAFLVVPFTPALAAVPAETFVHDIVVDRLHAALVVVGENFRFGHRGAGSVRTLQELGPRWGFAARGFDLVAAQDAAGRADEVVVSSTYVRACVDAGDVRAAAGALGRHHRVEGFVVHGEGRGGSELGYPTANLDMEPHTAVPADGIYAGWFVLGSRRSPTAISIGTNPTFSGKVRTVEAFVIDEGGNFYGRRVALEFVERLRPTWRFDSVEALIAQIDLDVARTREVLAAETT
ncbi:bifunctional riboflavin kinase/FAD synthetase [Nakamurella flavida]|uniref:Riboflavin biosynthesis protein n=1 Tax=Nakamurella flavida TaxID=363630 RepID=A0A938YL58_9ACTN|nr:bifunctional riboflavin kinase/FAD synthetase [Nakamurella flavida]MBM9475043.1 bifunctional riboflavin kinase/FAD synthetase [Nakamurella flavida]MDP9776611.1 riboflavin kinase/FMN adenylyltransferase [Nakamurella flavida]